MSSVTLKANPFQRENPFQVQQLSSIQKYKQYNQNHPTYHSTVQQSQSMSMLQKPIIPISHQWKFHQNNCKKPMIFNSQSSSIKEKSLTEKNSFEKQLILSHVAKKNNNNSGQQNINNYKDSRQKTIDNPFARKYLLNGGKLVESQVVYNPISGPIQQSNFGYGYIQGSKITETRTHSPYEQNYRYNYQITPNFEAPVYYQNNPTTITHLQTSLNYKYVHDNEDRYVSRTSLVKNETYNNNNINNPVGSYNYGVCSGQSKTSIDKNKQTHQNNNNQLSSNPNIPPSSNKYIQFRGSQAERDNNRRSSSKQNKNNTKVKFDQSDDQNDYGRRSQQRQPRFGSRKNLPQLPGPLVIEIGGCKFYKQNVDN